MDFIRGFIEPDPIRTPIDPCAKSMMLKAGIYQTIKPHVVLEKHGGGNIEHKVYWNLSFYSNTRAVGLFGSDKEDLKPYQDRSFNLKGAIIQLHNDRLELFILNPHTNIKRIYKGRIESDTLFLQYFHENNPEEVQEDMFHYIGTGETGIIPQYLTR